MDLPGGIEIARRPTLTTAAQDYPLTQALRNRGTPPTISRRVTAMEASMEGSIFLVRAVAAHISLDVQLLDPAVFRGDGSVPKSCRLVR